MVHHHHHIQLLIFYYPIFLYKMVFHLDLLITFFITIQLMNDFDLIQILLISNLFSFLYLLIYLQIIIFQSTINTIYNLMKIYHISHYMFYLNHFLSQILQVPYILLYLYINKHLILLILYLKHQNHLPLHLLLNLLIHIV